jgi:hypothetical protein
MLEENFSSVSRVLDFAVCLRLLVREVVARSRFFAMRLFGEDLRLSLRYGRGFV